MLSPRTVWWPWGRRQWGLRLQGEGQQEGGMDPGTEWRPGGHGAHWQPSNTQGGEDWIQRTMWCGPCVQWEKPLPHTTRAPLRSCKWWREASGSSWDRTPSPAEQSFSLRTGRTPTLAENSHKPDLVKMKDLCPQEAQILDTKSLCPTFINNYQCF